MARLEESAMGGHPYWYFVPYSENPKVALEALREREFKAGRYNPVLPFIELGADPLDRRYFS